MPIPSFQPIAIYSIEEDLSVQKPTGRKKNEMIHHKSEVRDSPCPVLYAMWKKNGFARCDAVIDNDVDSSISWQLRKSR